MTDPERSTSPDHTPAVVPADVPNGKNKSKAETSDVGTALRNAFRATLEEEIPSEMLDLLKRLD